MPHGSPTSATIRRYRADELLGPGPWIVIEHGGAEYRLQVTRLGKLILTK
jgi:hemin uptake protein HemP